MRANHFNFLINFALTMSVAVSCVTAFPENVKAAGVVSFVNEQSGNGESGTQMPAESESLLSTTQMKTTEGEESPSGTQMNTEGETFQTPPQVNADKPVTSISLNASSKTLAPGESFQLEWTVLPEDATNKQVTINSSNPGAATVSDSGLVQAVSIGTTNITVTAKDGSGKSATCEVIVKPKTYTQLLFEDNEIKLQPGEVQKIQGEVYPSDAINQEIFWESTNTEVATVERDDNKYRKAYIYGEKVGKCYIIARNKEGQEIGSIKVKVGNPSALEKMKNVKASKVVISELKRGKGTFKVKYKKVTDASGYQIKYKKSGKWLIIDTTKRSCTVKKLPKGTYKVKVRAYRIYNGKKYYGHFSKSQKIKVK